MKRDMDLVRTILLQVEEKAGDPRGWVELAIPGHPETEVSYHVMLLKEAGLLEAQNLSSSHGYEWKPKRLTWAGHEFVDAAKNDTIWNRTKETVREKGGSITFDLLKNLLLKTASAFFGLG